MAPANQASAAPSAQPATNPSAKPVQPGRLQAPRPRLAVRRVEPEVLDLRPGSLRPVVGERPPHGRADEAVRGVIEVWGARLVRVGKDTPLFLLLRGGIGPAPEFE